MALGPMALQEKENVYIGTVVNVSSGTISANAWNSVSGVTFPNVTGYTCIGAVVYPPIQYIVGATVYHDTGTSWTLTFYNNYQALSSRNIPCYPIYVRD